MKKIFRIAPSILSANFSKLGQEINDVISSGADIVHFDVMDNHYVPNLSFGPMVLNSLRNDGITANINVHLMSENINVLIKHFAKAGANSIVFHPKTSDNINKSISLIKSFNIEAILNFGSGLGLG